MDHTRKLPDEVMLAVLESVPVLDLPRCAQVCRRWRRLACDESLWTKVTLRGVTLSFKSLVIILQRGVRELKLDRTTIRESLAGDFRTNFKSPLRVLDLSSAILPPDCTRKILEHTSKLVTLRMPCDDIKESDHSFIGIGQNANLEILDLSDSYELEAACISYVVQSCKNLKELNLENADLDRRGLDALISNLHGNIVRLNLCSVSDYFRDYHVSTIVKKCPNLTHFAISQNYRLTPAVIEIVSKLEHLEELKYGKDEWVDESSSDDDVGYGFDLDESDALGQLMMYKESKDADDGMGIFHLNNINHIYNPGGF